MSFLKKVLEELKAVTELEENEERDVVLNAVDIISYMGKVDFNTKFNKEIYVILDKELRRDIESKGIMKVRTELNYLSYEFEINKLKTNMNMAKEKIEEIIGETCELMYSYEECNGIKNIKNMIVRVK